MRINIAVCDDELDICSQVERLLSYALKSISAEYNIDIFDRGERLCDEMRRTEYDLVFLDIELPNMNGVDIGRYIREELNNELVQIAYISSKKEYAMELFEYRPINFLVKPLDDEKIRKVIKKYMVISEQENHMFSYKKGYEFYKIPMSKIMYFDTGGRKTVMVTTEGREEFYASMESVYQRVKGHKFLFIHKSTIVNYKYINKFGYEDVVMTDGSVFSISQSRRKAIRSMFMDIKKEER